MEEYMLEEPYKIFLSVPNIDTKEEVFEELPNGQPEDEFLLSNTTEEYTVGEPDPLISNTNIFIKQEDRVEKLQCIPSDASNVIKEEFFIEELQVEQYMNKDKMVRELGKWSQEQLTQAMDAVLQQQWAVRRAAEIFGVPRRTLRNHLASGNSSKVKGRKPVLSTEQELKLCQRIHSLADVGMPVTPKMVKRTVFTFCTMMQIKTPFNADVGSAGRKWFKLFMQRHPDVAKRKL